MKQTDSLKRMGFIIDISNYIFICIKVVGIRMETGWQISSGKTED